MSESNGLPPWWHRTASAYLSGEAHFVILHGIGVTDLTQYQCSFGEYLERCLAFYLLQAPVPTEEDPEPQAVGGAVWYARHSGFTFGSGPNEAQWKQAFSLTVAETMPPAPSLPGQAIQPAEQRAQALNLQAFAPPGSALPALDRVMRQHQRRFVVVVEFPEALVPESQWASMSGEDRTALSTLLSWAAPEFADNGHLVILVARNLNDLHSSLRAASAHILTVEVPYPDLRERTEYISRLANRYTEQLGADAMALEPTEAARLSAGMGRLHIEDVFLAARQAAVPVDRDRIAEHKRQVVKAEFGDVLEPWDPTAGFESIGGCEHVKAFFRRQLIDPVRRGDQRRVPKGVLMIGPPGTGKSRMASAVACEAGMNAVKFDPSKVFDKWVGASLAEDEEVILFPRTGLPVRLTMEEMTRTWVGDGIVSANTDGTTVIKRVDGAMCHGERPTILRLKTKTGREIRVTHDHSLFTRSGDYLRDTRGDELRVGAEIAVPCGWEVPHFNRTVNLLAMIPAEERRLWIIHGASEVMSQEEIVQCAGSCPAHYLKYDRAPLKTAWDVVGEERLKGARIARKSGNVSHPVQFTITPQMAFFIGNWIADGSSSNGGLRITCNADDEADILREIGEIQVTSHQDQTGNARSLFLSDWALAKTLILLGCHGGGGEKRVPAWVFGADDELATAFLRGYFTGDGSYHGNNLECSTISKGLAGDLLHLLARFRIMGHLKHRPNLPNSKAGICGKIEGHYRITVSKAAYNRRFVERIGFAQKRKNEAIRSHLASLRHEWPEKVMWNVYWDAITEIEEVPYSGKVYDLSIEDTHRFTSGFGGILVHNSERNLSRALRALTTFEPALVFIDEIDQMGLNRGGEGNSGTSDRVFGMMLEFMAREENRGRVCFLAASNRPDLLDAALKRPGRFDKKIVFGPPDPVERNVILAMHLCQQIPGLSLDFDTVKPWVENLEWWTGAELEALAIKAAEIYADDDPFEPNFASVHPAVTEALRLFRPSTGSIQEQTMLALAEVSDLELLPPAYRSLALNAPSSSASSDPSPATTGAAAPRKRRNL